MPGSVRTFEYTLVPQDGDDAEQMARQARKILGWACDGDPRITCHGVGGEMFGAIQLSMTIVGRDQWWSRQLAQDLVNMVTWGLRNPARMDILSTRKAPHMNRGYAHGRVKQWRERASAAPA
jgi:hypothetical protein